MRQFLEDARRLLAISSVTTEGNESCANHVATLMRSRGLKVQLQHVGHSIDTISKRQFNVVGVFGDPLVDKKTRKGLLLLAHLDTVGPGRKEAWTETGGDPLLPAARDGRLIGLGAANSKVDFLCKLRAMEKFREQKLKMPIYLVGTCGGEMGMFGARYLLKSLALNPKYVLAGAPTDLKVVHASKRHALFRVSIGYSRVSKDARGFNRRVLLTALGLAAHGANPEFGVNAILRLLEFIRLAEEAGFDLRITALSGGAAANQVPDQASAELFLTSHQLEDFRRFFAEYCENSGLGEAFRVEFGGLGEAGVQFLPDQVFQAACDSVGYFGQLAGELARLVDESFSPSHATVSFSQISERPGFLDLYFDLRLLPETPLEELESELRGAFQQLGAHYPGLNLTVLRERTNAPLVFDEGQEFLGVCVDALVRSAGVRAEEARAKTAISTEGSLFSGAGYQALVFGAGVVDGNVHSPNESIEGERLDRAVRFYEQVIEKVCV